MPTLAVGQKNFPPDNDVDYTLHREFLVILNLGIMYGSSADLSPVGEDDAESDETEDEEARGAGGDDQQVEAGRRRVRRRAVLHRFEVSYTLKQNST